MGALKFLAVAKIQFSFGLDFLNAKFQRIKLYHFNMKKLYTFLLIVFISLQLNAQQTENIFIITFDGLRWQELFTGADSLLIDDSGYVKNPEKLTGQYWHRDPLKRREMLMPFFWSTIAKEGVLYGNRKFDNKVDCSNQMWFSYPGYNEILCGFADDENISSNKKIPNPNTTVLEFLNNETSFKGQVAAFGSWDVFPFIINEQRSGVPVNAGFDRAEGDDLSKEERLLNKLQEEIRGPWGSVRLDPFTHHYALEYIKRMQPKVLYISYGETDDFAHDGEYDQYLYAAQQTDQYIKELWEYVQSNDHYKDKTTFLITTDHGRGTYPKDTWRSHGIDIDGGGEIWIAAIGPDTPALGEVKDVGQLYQNQVAATATMLLGLEYKTNKTAGKPVEGIME